VLRTTRRSVVRGPPTPGRTAGRYGAMQAQAASVEIGVVALGAHGSRNRADEPASQGEGKLLKHPLKIYLTYRYWVGFRLLSAR
jgi:hypothetical protein